jgi:hypothetical protein
VIIDRFAGDRQLFWVYGRCNGQGVWRRIQYQRDGMGSRDSHSGQLSIGSASWRAAWSPIAPRVRCRMEAIAAAMRYEYEPIVAAGFDLQIDCPDLAMGRHIQYANLDLPEFRRRATAHVEALNHALANIPAERVRMHVCWGNYEGPHHYDVPLPDIVDIIFSARPASISFEAANPRHAHEWALFEAVKLPTDKILIPGVIESKSNFIEHPELIAPPKFQNRNHCRRLRSPYQLASRS